MVRKYLIAISLLTLLVCCNKKETQSTVKNENIETNNHTSKNSLDIEGTYKGAIPCDDCEKVELTLKKDNKYFLILHLASDSEENTNKTIKTEGIYTWSEDGSTISLDQYNLQLKVGENKLFYLDETLSIHEDEVLIKQ